jgi:hypothetical protein
LTLYTNHENAVNAQEAHDLMTIRLAENKLAIGDFYFNARNNGKTAIIMYNKTAHFLPGSQIEHSAREKIAYIKAGNLPKATPVDLLFGRYQRPSDEQLIDSLVRTERKEVEEGLDFQNDLIHINTDSNSDRESILESIDRKIKPDGSFIKIGPNKEF